MKQKMIKFMYGRYGIDKLYMFMFYLFFILQILNLFIRTIIIDIIELIIFIIMFYRVLSKNINKRKKEEKLYLEIKQKIINLFKKNKFKYDKEHIYKKCKKCKTIIRLPLPNNIGINCVKCPKCKTKNKVFSLKKQKIEFFRKK